MKFPLRYWLMYLWCIPIDILVWSTVLFIWILWGKDLRWNCGLWCTLKPNSWPTRSWYRIKRQGVYVAVPPSDWEALGRWQTWGGTTLGHGGFTGPGAGERTAVHENVHVEQFEVIVTACTVLLGMNAGLLLLTEKSINPLPFIITWISGAFIITLSGWLVAWFRGEDPYRGSAHEEAAYSITEEYFRKKEGLE